MTVVDEQVTIPAFSLSKYMIQTHALLGIQVYNWISLILIFIALVYVYNKVFRTRRLPLLKNTIVYLIIAVGAFVLLIFQTDAGLPILYCLGVAVILMVLVKIRYWVEGREQGKQETRQDRS